MKNEKFRFIVIFTALTIATPLLIFDISWGFLGLGAALFQSYMGIAREK